MRGLNAGVLRGVGVRARRGSAAVPHPQAARHHAKTAVCQSGTMNAAGSNAQANAMDAWTTAHQQACPGATINRNPNGSCAGSNAFNAGLTMWNDPKIAAENPDVKWAIGYLELSFAENARVGIAATPPQKGRRAHDRHD